MNRFVLLLPLVLAAAPAWAAEPDNLVLPPGFHASVVAEALGPARHLAIRDKNDIYVSTRSEREPAEPLGIIALRLGRDGKVVETEHFSNVSGGTGIRFYKGALYADSPTAVYRFAFKGSELVPSAAPEILIDGMPANGFPSRGLAFDGKGGLYVTAGASSNICLDPAAPKGAPPLGLKPCPSLETRSGVWRFDAEKSGQKFPTDGEQIATGLRDMMAVDWSRELNGFYGVMQGRNDRIDTVSEELHRIDRGANLGWPYTYYDIALHARVTAPEYGGDGNAKAEGNYDAPLEALPAHQSPLDLVFYDGKQFPSAYRGGAFIVYHGGAGALLPDGHRGYDVMFLPFDHGVPGQPQSFIEGFAGPAPGDRNPGKAIYRPTGAAVAPDGSLYVVEGEKGRLWHITYDGKGDGKN
jgi:glucose/arabinose dehydrogenase